MIVASLGNRIRILRKQTGLSQEKFALKIGMDRTYFASVEAGRRNIAVRNIEKIAKGLGITLSELFLGLEKEIDQQMDDEEVRKTKKKGYSHARR